MGPVPMITNWGSTTNPTTAIPKIVSEEPSTKNHMPIASRNKKLRLKYDHSDREPVPVEF